MALPSLGRARRLVLAVPMAVVLSGIAQSADAAGDPNSDVNNAKQQLQQAQSQAKTVDAQLSNAKSNLAAANAQLAAIRQRISDLDAQIAGDTAKVQQLNDQLAQDKAHLAAYLRNAYENGGSEAALMYLLESQDIAMVIQRKVQLDHVSDATQSLLDRIRDETEQTTQALSDAQDARVSASAAEQQARTTQAIVAVAAIQVQQADIAAHSAVSASQNQLAAALAAQAAAQAAARAKSGVVFQPVPGSTFTIDTDLTQPSGETAQKLNAFLQGTAMAGLGDSFMKAEHDWHVSARYFVAHAILESAWGTSAIAQIKHNLFGFNANDADPFNDASSFPSFDACIQYVAKFVSVNYLQPSGRYYHGPTLRGMNVDYASDPLWAEKIATIANTIP
ncbi:MAG TPA: glucosaminidase domain-containing protein [Candidatus Dormibacteraeota bacterium]|nr:glucosaminidase domain-containing protein [Candidatus Dormibacteraeota bacterium]